MRRTLVSISLGLAALVGFATQASAQNCTIGTPGCAGGLFIIDGSIPDPGALLTPDVNGSVKELGPTNSSTTKVGVIHGAPLPMLDNTNPNGQVDLNTIYTKTATAANGHIWFYFAWIRDSNKGSGFISIEMQQAAAPSACNYSQPDATLIATCNPWANRQAGDFLILWDQSGSSLTLYKRVFQLVNGSLVLGPATVLGTAKAAFSADNFSGEGAIDLTADVFPSSGACESFANTIPGTVTGNSDTADYKDAVLSAFPPISNCGTLKVVKATDPTTATGPTGGFGYTVARADNSQLRFDGTKTLSDTLSGNADSDTFLNLIIGTNYTVTEDLQSLPWEFVSTSCVIKRTGEADVSAGPATGFTIGTDGMTVCTINNKLNMGALKVIKHVVNNNGGTATAADFTMNLGNNGANSTTFSGSETGVTTTLIAGTNFNVTESGSFTSTYNATIGGSSNVNDTNYGPDCSGTIVAGVTKVCYVLNDDKPVSLTLNKTVTNDNGGTKTESAWNLKADGGTAGVLQGPGAAGNADVVSGATFKQGTYALSENLIVSEPNNGGYTAGSWSCVKNGGAPVTGASITLGLGDTAVCTINNNDNPASPSGTTAQTVILRDSISIPGIRDGATDKSSATATFRLYTDNTCTTPVMVGGVQYQEAIALSYTAPNNGSVTGSASTATGVTVPGPKALTTYYWRVQYSGDNFNSGFNTSCTAETTQLVISQ